RLAGGVDTAGPPSKDTLKRSLSRHLQSSSSAPSPQVANDDAREVNGT
ncbi:unnamed protein product, partial [Laminaria digitata]